MKPVWAEGRRISRRGMLPGLWMALLLLTVPGRADAQGIRLALPPGQAILLEEAYLLCGVAPPGIEEVLVETSKEKDAQPVNQGAFAIPLALSPGENTIRLRTPDGLPTEVVLWRLAAGESGPSSAQKLHIHPDEALELEDCSVCHTEEDQRQGLWSRVQAGEAGCIDCHDGDFDFPHLHGPVGTGACVSCHNPHGSNSTFFLSATGKDLCARCHKSLEPETWTALHLPYEEGECSACHQPHGGKSSIFSPTETIAETCFSCHDRDDMTRLSKHAPAAEGDCTTCHAPHGSEHSYLTVLAGNALCLDCHGDIQESLHAAEPHPPAQENCLDCHQPHSSDHAPLLRAGTLALCSDCHEEVGQAASGSPSPHSPVTEGKCGSCHEVHGSDRSHLLQQEQPALCFLCHRDLGQQLAASQRQHSPVEDGQCDECHRVHGSEHPRLLNAYLAPDFYVPYSPRAYEFCFQCHDEEIAEEQTGTTATEFRNGDWNLHYLHVHQPKGRSCRSCHDPHAADQEKLVHRGIPFGDWEIPIDFSQRSGGGRCAAGCHRPKEYHRTSQ